MKSTQKFMRTVVSAAVLATIATSIANAGGFALYTEGSPAALGNFAAGIAAEAGDASTGWYNPAGLSLLHLRESVVGIMPEFPSARISGTSIYATQGVPSYIQTFSKLQGAKMAYVPTGHYAIPLGQNMTFGLSLVAPYGLATQWNREGPVRYAGTTSHLVTINVSPEIGARVNQYLALGLGIDLQYARVRLQQVIGSPATLQLLGVPTLLDSVSYNRGNSYGFGFHAGGMLLFNDDHTRIGLNYQSQVRHRFDGFGRLQGRLASLPANPTPLNILTADSEAIFWSTALTSNNITFPDVTTLSVYRDINTRLALLASAVFTGWNSFDSIELDRAAAYSTQLGQVLVDNKAVTNYHNAWRLALGANYQLNDTVMLRVGGGWDQTPSRNAYRDTRIPDVSRWAASVGAHYQLQPTIGFDFGYTHLFAAGDFKINRTNVVSTDSSYTVRADIKAHADLLGLQAVWIFDQPVAPIAPTK